MTVKSPDSLVTSIATSNRFELIVGLLTLSSVVLALVLYIPEIELSTSQNNAIYIFDLGVVAVLAFDFVIRIKASKKGIKYVIRHFYEIPAMIPLIAFAMFEDPLIIGAAVRSIRFVRMLRLLRLFRLANLFRTAQHWKLNTFLYLATILAASVIFGAIAIYFVEVEETGKTITDLEDALWFAVTTITISGFGDVYPISTAGRLVAAILSFIGLAIILGFISSIGASVIVSRLSRNQNNSHQGTMDLIKNKIDNLQKLNEGELTELTSTIVNLYQRMKRSTSPVCTRCSNLYPLDSIYCNHCGQKATSSSN